MLEYYPVEHEGKPSTARVSIGVTTATSPVDHPDELPDRLIRAADNLMYQAKQRGRNWHGGGTHAGCCRRAKTGEP